MDRRSDSVSPFTYDYTQSGWELVELVNRQWVTNPLAYGPTVPDHFVPDQIDNLLKIVPFLKKDGSPVQGYEMRHRGIWELDRSCGQFISEWLLKWQKFIPKKWQKFYIVLPGTVWRHSIRRFLGAPCLYWQNTIWYMDLGNKFYERYAGRRLMEIRNL